MQSKPASKIVQLGSGENEIGDPVILPFGIASHRVKTHVQNHLQHNVSVVAYALRFDHGTRISYCIERIGPPELRGKL